MDKKEDFLRALATAVKQHVDAQLEPHREQINLMQDRLDHAEARLHDLEAKEQTKLYDVKPRIRANVG